MKSKKGVYFLLVVVLAIWGSVIYKLFFQNKGGDDYVMNRPVFAPEQIDLTSLNDTFSIHSNYRDPFLGKGIEKHIKTLGAVPAIKPIEKTTVATLKWPAVSFHGLIRNQKSNKQIALVQIEGHTYNMTPGDIQSGIELKRCFKDSVQLLFNMEKRTVKK